METGTASIYLAAYECAYTQIHTEKKHGYNIWHAVGMTFGIVTYMRLKELLNLNLQGLLYLKFRRLDEISSYDKI